VESICGLAEASSAERFTEIEAYMHHTKTLRRVVLLLSLEFVFPRSDVNWNKPLLFQDSMIQYSFFAGLLHLCSLNKYGNPRPEGAFCLAKK
jgi:hypothetical protein